MLLDLVMGAADSAEVAAAGQAALVPGERVVQVASGGWLPAGGEAAGEVASRYLISDRGRWPVGSSGAVMGASAGQGVGRLLCVGTGSGQAGGSPGGGQDLAEDSGRARVLGRRPVQDRVADGQCHPADQPRAGAVTAG